MLHLFDLDGTVIDSFHRVKPCLKENGDLDLAKYKSEACKHELIQRDQLLPLVSYMRERIAAARVSGDTVGICTARLLSKSDYVFLRKHGIKTDLIYSRDKLAKYFGSDAPRIYSLGDTAYKAEYIKLAQRTRDEKSIVLYDDHDGVLDMAWRLGVLAYDAKVINKDLELLDNK